MIAPWPPLITHAAQPTWMVWRDRLLTVAMWLLLVGVCRNELTLLWSTVHDVLGGELAGRDARWDIPWDRLKRLAAVIGVLVVWLGVWGAIALRHVSQVTREPVPLPIDPAAEAEQVAATPEAVQAWRMLPVAVVHTDESGRLRVTPKQA
jgi:hypothetical protein